MAIDFDRCARERLGEQLGEALSTLGLIGVDDNGRRLTSAATAAAVFRELAGMIGAKESFRVKADTLAGRMGRHRSAIVRALSALRSLGLVLHTRTGRSSLYTLDWPAARAIVEQAARRREGRPATPPAEQPTLDQDSPPGAARGRQAGDREDRGVELAPAQRAPTAGALCAISGRTVRHQIAHRAPSTPPEPIYPQEHPPPPPAAGEGAGWIEAERSLIRAGVGAVGAALQLARQNGYSAEQVKAIADLVADTAEGSVRAWGPGVIFSRFRNGSPRQPIEAALPPASAEYRQAVARRQSIERQAARAKAEQQRAAEADRLDADRERRLGPRLDRLSKFERERLARGLSRFYGDLARRSPDSPALRVALLAALDRGDT